jgi:hypothetical protein
MNAFVADRSVVERRHMPDPDRQPVKRPCDQWSREHVPGGGCRSAPQRATCGTLQRARQTRHAALQRTAEDDERRTHEHHQFVLNHVHGKELN